MSDNVKWVTVEWNGSPEGLRYTDPKSWTEEIWKALHAFREALIPEGDEMYDDQWSDITTAMAWIEERLGVPSD